MTLWLQDNPRPGRPDHLSQVELEQVRQDLLRSPRELGYDQTLWDGLLLLITWRKNTLFSWVSAAVKVSSMSWGFRLQRPRPQASEVDIAKQEAFKKIWSANARP